MTLNTSQKEYICGWIQVTWQEKSLGSSHREFVKLGLEETSASLWIFDSQIHSGCIGVGYQHFDSLVKFIIREPLILLNGWNGCRFMGRWAHLSTRHLRFESHHKSFHSNLHWIGNTIEAFSCTDILDFVTLISCLLLLFSMLVSKFTIVLAVHYGTRNPEIKCSVYFEAITDLGTTIVWLLSVMPRSSLPFWYHTVLLERYCLI